MAKDALRVAGGVWEALITEALEERLGTLEEEGRRAQVDALRFAEAGERLGQHVGRVLQQALEAVPERERVEAGVRLARALVAQIVAELGGAVKEAAALKAEAPVDGAVLHAVLSRRIDGAWEEPVRPVTPLLDTALLTNAPGEPRLAHQVASEVGSADRIDVVMAFIRQTGLVGLWEGLAAHVAAGRPLRVLTTTYTGTTEARALERLVALGAEVRVSYDTARTRLHAKAWLFHRASGFPTAYIGSSNLTHAAQVTGLEWNLRVSGRRNPDVIARFEAVFESYWQSGDFVPYDPERFAEAMATGERRGPSVLLSPVELRLEPFQERLLEEIALARQRGQHRNLLVSATGTGKTVMAAVDYARLAARGGRARLLFVAHREELLRQSQATFAHALRDPAFGELWVGGQRPQRFEHVFASIQSLRAAGLAHLPPDHFDVVIVDEFHHAAAPSYEALLDHVQPSELLGLTATPERSDGLDVLRWFGGRIAAELRLWDAVEQQRLAPFHYYGVHDGLDLREIPWRRGRGYDVEGLSALVTGNEVWARQVLAQVARRVADPGAMRALGFCVSVAHARFMARCFTEAGLAAVAVWADTPEAERRAALAELASGRVQAVFSVDLFNEGVDVPQVDTLLMLRPTESATLFIQQLGRGLRQSPGKSACVVLDFVGQHRAEFRVERRFQALLGGGRRAVQAQIEAGFPLLPAGCHMELDPVAQRVVLESLRAAVPARWSQRVEALRQLAAGADATLSAYLADVGLEVEELYTSNRGWSALREAAGLPVAPPGPEEATLRRACGRLLHVDDPERLAAWRGWLTHPTPPAPATLSERERRLLRMLVASMMDQVGSLKGASLDAGAALLWAHPQVCAELAEVFALLEDRIKHVGAPLASRPDAPLRVHARYTRLELLAALGVGEGPRVAPWQTGVRFADEARADLLAFTLDKTSGAFSPTTRYRDYAISRELIHWESQSVTRADSATGRRYQGHAAAGSAILLFARLQSGDRAFWFLGPAQYVSHQGELPMAITWRLEHALPGDMFVQFAAAVA